FFDTFAIIDIMTQGGPGSSTSILVYKVYNACLKGLDIGSSAAQSVILMIIVVLLTAVQFRYIDRKVNYCRVANAAYSKVDRDRTPPYSRHRYPPRADTGGGHHCLSPVRNV